jgi:SAM-dependent methyltransferase
MKRLREQDVLQLLDSNSLVLDVGSGGGIFPSVPRGDVCVDIDIPVRTVPNDFVRSDASHLPFRAGTFSLVIAFNVLEHVEDPRTCIEEFLRVGSKVICRQDKLLHIPMWATPEHLWLQLPGFRFLPFPRTRLGIRLSVLLRSFVLGKSKLASLARRLPLWRNWEYYQVSPDI